MRSDNSRKPSKPLNVPTVGQAMAAQLAIKRAQEGKGKIPITPKIRYMASFVTEN